MHFTCPLGRQTELLNKLITPLNQGKIARGQTYKHSEYLAIKLEALRARAS